MRARRNERRRRETRQARKQGGRNARQERNDNETRDGTAGGTIGETRERLFFLSRHSDKLNTTHENEGTPFHVSPDPLPPALSCPPTSYNPPPPRRGMSRREQDSHAGGMMIAGEGGRAVPFSRYRSFAISHLLRRRIHAPFLSAHFGDPRRCISIRGGGVGRSRPSPP